MAKELPAAIIDRLCGHIQTEAFTAGTDHDFLDIDLDDYRRQFSDGHEVAVFVLLAEKSEVVGYVAVDDLVVPKASERYLSIPAVAVAEKWRGGNAGFRLIAKALAVAHLRNESHYRQSGTYRYDGIACVPWTKELRAAVDRQHFTPLEGTLWWIRRFRRRRP